MELQEKLLSFLKEHALALVLGIVGLSFLIYGLASMTGQRADKGIDFQSGTSVDAEDASSSAKVEKQLTVDIEGAVEKPGVYTLPADSRVQDVLVASGGLAESADRSRVSKMLNLAAPLTDGAKLYIPAVGEQMTAPGNGSTTTSDMTSMTLGTQTSVININTATESELDKLPGVGPVTAQKIISNRPYQNTHDLVDKKVVGASTFEKIKEQVTVY